MLETESLRDASDADLACRLAGGDPAAMPELYRRLAPRVRLYGLRHLRNAAAADDLVQDALLMAFELLQTGRVREPERFVSFVLGCCRRIVADLHRGAERRQELLKRFGAGLGPDGTSELPPMDLERLASCLMHLTERERSVVMMTFYAETPSERIGTELGLSTGNVRVVRHRALARLRTCMEGA